MIMTTWSSSPARDEWTTLPPCPAHYFGLGHLSGELLTVGGATSDDTIIKTVYRYKPESREWEEFLQPMPTARYGLSVISTQSALIACGGTTRVSGGKAVPCTAVEVYTAAASQWATSHSLPIPSWRMSSATITNTGYLLGGMTTDSKLRKTVLSASIPSLLQKATSRPKQSASAARLDSTSSAWKILQDSPLLGSAAASLGGITLLTVGGVQDGQGKSSVHAYCPATGSWTRVESGDVPEPRYFCTAVELSAKRILVIGGRNEDNKKMNTVFLRSFTMMYTPA